MIIIAVFLFTAFTMILYHLKYGTEGNFIKRVVLEAASPLQEILTVSVKGIEDTWLRYIMLVGLEAENRALKKQINELNAVIVSYKEGYDEAERLKKLLAITEDHHYRFVAARVIGRDQTSMSRTIMINKGSSDGLKAGMPVVAPPGLVGRLVDVSWNVSRVLLFHDENSNVDAIVRRNRSQGIVSGAGSRGMILKYIPKTQEIQEGDDIISSGMSGVFPKGWLIGRVMHVDRQDAGLFLKISVASFADYSKLEEVLILSSELYKEE